MQCSSLPRAQRRAGAQGAGETSLLQQPMTFLDANGETGQRQSHARAPRGEKQPTPLGKPGAPSALPELPGPGSGDRPPPQGLALRPAQPVASQWVPRRGCSPELGTLKREPLHPGPRSSPGKLLPTACEGWGCGAGGSAASQRNWEQKGVLR